MRKTEIKHTQQIRSLRTLFLFCIVVVVLILGSLTIRFLSMLRDSSFDGEHRFTILVTHSARSASVVSLDPKTNSASLVFLRHKARLPEVGKYMRVAIDGRVSDKEELTEASSLRNALFRYTTRFGGREEGLTSLDMFRLWALSLGIQHKDIQTKTLEASLTEEEVDEFLSEMFVDDTLANEKISVEIVNASGITGRGSRLERVLVNSGIPVVQVTTAAKTENTSSIAYAASDSYTLKKLSTLLGFPASSMDEQGLSDIIVVLGRDAEAHRQF